MTLINDIDTCVLPYGECAFWWLGQLGFVVKLGNKIIYIDAFLSDYPGRNIPPMLNPADIKHADFILGTHDHCDHIDRDTWPILSVSSPDAIFVVPALLRNQLSQQLDILSTRFIGIDDLITTETADIRITGIACAHEFLDRDMQTGQFPYMGYVIEGNGCTIYHAGDTCRYDGMVNKFSRWKNIDVAFLPINGRDATRYRSGCIGNMTYQEAVDLAGELRPALVVPAHFDMFTGNSENPDKFIDYLSAKYPNVSAHVPIHGKQLRVKAKVL